MIRLLFILSLTLSATTLHAFSWQDIVGCYRSELIDGSPVPMGLDYERSLTKVEYGTSTVFESLEKVPLKHLLLVLFTGAEEPWYNYHSFVLFPDLGNFQTVTDRLSYQIDQDVYLMNWNQRTKVDHYLKVELEQDGEQIIGEALYESQIRRLSGQRTFTLKKVACP